MQFSNPHSETENFMKLFTSTRKLILAGTLGIGLLAAPAVAGAAPATTKAPAVTTYTVVAGTFHTQAQADKRLTLITGKGVTGLGVVKTGTTVRSTRYRIEETGMTRLAARTLWRTLRHDHFSAYFTRP